MKACEVLNLLRVSIPALTNYVKQGIIDAVKLPNGRYDYDEKTVYGFMNKDIPRKNVLYARVSTKKRFAKSNSIVKKLLFSKWYSIYEWNL